MAVASSPDMEWSDASGEPDSTVRAIGRMSGSPDTASRHPWCFRYLVLARKLL